MIQYEVNLNNGVEAFGTGKTIQYEVNLNNGVEAFGTGKTITANEVLLTCDV